MYVYISKGISRLSSHLQWPPTSLAPGSGFVEDNFCTESWGDGGCGMIQAHYAYCALYFYYYYYIRSTSDHQALDPGGLGPLL